MELIYWIIMGIVVLLIIIKLCHYIFDAVQVFKNRAKSKVVYGYSDEKIIEREMKKTRDKDIENEYLEVHEKIKDVL